MFKSIHVKNFQSLKDVEVELAPFTVIVGATDSGKSAFYRAISTLISNRRGAEFITYGEKRCTITAELEQGKLTLQRGKATADNFYEIDDGTEKQLYTKLSGTVPEEVSNFLRIPAKDPINLASQFDKPYLLDTKEYSSADAARILGALTNVNLVFEGARESNRRKGEASTKLKTRSADAEAVTEQLHGYDDLSAKAEAIDRAEAAVAHANKLEVAKNELGSLIEAIKSSNDTLYRLAPETTVEIPDISEIEALHAAKEALSALIAGIQAEEAKIPQYRAAADAEAVKLEELDSQYREILRKEGTCPVCGQTTSSLDSAEH